MMILVNFYGIEVTLQNYMKLHYPGEWWEEVM